MWQIHDPNGAATKEAMQKQHHGFSLHRTVAKHFQVGLISAMRDSVKTKHVAVRSHGAMGFHRVAPMPDYFGLKLR